MIEHLVDNNNTAESRLFECDDSDAMSVNVENNSLKDHIVTKESDSCNLIITPHVERVSQDKMNLQNHLNSRISELKAHIVKLTSSLERSETQKSELEVSLTKANSETRNSQRRLQFKSAESEKFKDELSKYFKGLEENYILKINQLKSTNEHLNSQLREEKANLQRKDEMINDKINQLVIKLSTKEEELSKSSLNELKLKEMINKLELKIKNVTEKLDTQETSRIQFEKQLAEKDKLLEEYRDAEIKYKGHISELDVKINKLENNAFSSKQESREYKQSLQEFEGQTLDLKHKLAMKEKEYDILLERVANYAANIKDLECCLETQEKLTKINLGQTKKLESNEEEKEKLGELETNLKAQQKIIEETNNELITLRDSESTVISNYTCVIMDLEKLIKNYFGDEAGLQDKLINNVDSSGEGIEYNKTLPKKLINKLKQLITVMQDKLNATDTEKIESLEKMKEQEREIKALKLQARKQTNQLKTLESTLNEKEQEIGNLYDENCRLKTNITTIKSDSLKAKTTLKNNVDNLKQTLGRISEENTESIAERDHYLTSIALLLQDALRGTPSVSCLANSYESKIEEDLEFETEPEPDVTNCATQTSVVSGNNWPQQSNNPVELVGNLTGTFSILNQDPKSPTGKGTNKTAKSQSDIIWKKLQTSPVVKMPETRKKFVSSKKDVGWASNSQNDVTSSFVLDSNQAWPHLKDIIASELSILLQRYDINRKQSRNSRIDQNNANCRHLMNELISRDNLIEKLMQQNQKLNEKVPINVQMAMDKNSNKVFSNQNNSINPSAVQQEVKKKSKPVNKNRNEQNSTILKRTPKQENKLPHPPCCCGDNETIPLYNSAISANGSGDKQNVNLNRSLPEPPPCPGLVTATGHTSIISGPNGGIMFKQHDSHQQHQTHHHNNNNSWRIMSTSYSELPPDANSCFDQQTKLQFCQDYYHQQPPQHHQQSQSQQQQPHQFIMLHPFTTGPAIKSAIVDTECNLTSEYGASDFEVVSRDC